MGYDGFRHCQAIATAGNTVLNARLGMVESTAVVSAR
jgi:hypothetical protein